MKNLFILFVAVFFSFLVFNYSDVVSAQGWSEGQAVVSGGNTGLPETSAEDVVLSVLKWLLSLVFFLTVLAFVGSGIMFILSFSNNGIITMAKDWLTYAIIGLVVSVLGFVIVLAISNVLTGGSPSGSSGSSSSGSWWDNINIWGQDNNGNSVEINTNGDGATVSGSLGDVDFSIPVPISPGSSSGSSSSPSGEWTNPDTGQTYDYNTGR